MSKRLLVVLTVPHSYCINKKVRDCDRVALENAIKLSNSLGKRKINNILLKANIIRSKKDLNRILSYGTLFHRRFDNILNKNMDKHMLVLDIHSGDFDLIQYLTILVQLSLNDNILINRMKQITYLNYTTTIRLGAKDNYIVEKAISRNISALLFEFNENHKYPKSFHNKIVDAILYWNSKTNI
jgi:hypothetical protein